LEGKLRKSYKGGAVQVLKDTGTNLYFNDVNSLYPHSMTSSMPLHFLDVLMAKEIDLDTFTGFIYAVITLQQGKTPVVPHHDTESDRLIYPTERFEGLFYAEELRSAVKFGYKVTFKFGYLFSTKDLFSQYVSHFYNKKLALDAGIEALQTPLKELEALLLTDSTNDQIKQIKSVISSREGERFIVKLLLNGLYGYFGRKPYNPQTSIVAPEKLDELIKSFSINNVINLTYNLSLVSFNPGSSLNKDNSVTPVRPTFSNVAIASRLLQ
jgi:DNA polymerase type B, organellar and viral